MTNAFTASGLFGSLFCDPKIAHAFGEAAFVSQMLAYEAAWTKALVQTGQVSDAAAQKALAAIAAYTPQNLGLESDRDGLPVPALVKRLKDGLPEDVAKAIHTGTTSQDVIDTATVLTCLHVAEDLHARLQDVIASIETLENRFAVRPMMTRTRMQTALPATVGLRLGAWRRPLEAHLNRYHAMRKDLAYVQVGGPIGRRDNTVSDEVANHVAKTLGLAVGPVWHADRSSFIEFGHWLSFVAGSLGKIGQDVTLMAQQGIDEITLSGSGGSSAMPHKQNPIAAETLVTLARFVSGQQGILLQAMVHEQERSGSAWALEWMTLPAMAEATGAALNQALRLTAAIEDMGSSD